MGFLSFLATPLGMAMSWLYQLVQNYGWTIIIFTFLVRIVMFPLTMKQQKSQARMAAYQPMIAEIQKKWANDKARQQQEVQKFYEENNIKMSAGCLPMAVNLVVLFGIIAVIQAPLNYIVGVPNDQINNGIAIVQAIDPDSEIASSGAAYTQQALLIGEIRENPQVFIDGAEVPAVDGITYVLQEGETYENGQIVKDGKVVKENAEMHYAAMDPEMVNNIEDFKFDFMGLNLAVAPSLTFNRYLIMPILSVLLQIASQIVIMKTSPSGQQSAGQMWMMTILFSVMFGFYAFRVPVGFSLYYATSSVAMTLQQLLVRKIYDPAKEQEKLMAELEERKAAKKANKKVKVRTQDGQVESVEMSETELNRLRLQKAREEDAMQYGATDKDSDEAQKAAETARQLDEEKYGPSAPPTRRKKDKAVARPSDMQAEDVEWTEVPEGGDEGAAPPKEQAPQTGQATPAEGETTQPPPTENNTPAPKAKPGRRKRARQNKQSNEQPHGEEASFADSEQAAEQKQESEANE